MLKGTSCIVSVNAFYHLIYFVMFQYFIHLSGWGGQPPVGTQSSGAAQAQAGAGLSITGNLTHPEPASLWPTHQDTPLPSSSQAQVPGTGRRPSALSPLTLSNLGIPS